MSHISNARLAIRTDICNPCEEWGSHYVNAPGEMSLNGSQAFVLCTFRNDACLSCWLDTFCLDHLRKSSLWSHGLRCGKVWFKTWKSLLCDNVDVNFFLRFKILFLSYCRELVLRFMFKSCSNVSVIKTLCHLWVQRAIFLLEIINILLYFMFIQFTNGHACSLYYFSFFLYFCYCSKNEFNCVYIWQIFH